MKRREMLKLTGTTAAIAAGIRSGRAYGFSANETINIGCIGTGGRCRMLMQTLTGIEKTRMPAVCDVYDWCIAEAKKIADPQATTTKDYHEVLDRKDIDAVLIGSPDHWHVPMTVDACNAGKDVYVEKPLTHNIAEGPAVIEAQNRNQRIVQVGTQQRSMPHIIKAREILLSGRLGKIHKAHLTWNRNADEFKRTTGGISSDAVDWKRFLGTAKDQPFDGYRFSNWRWFWDFGGGILTDLMVHWLDVVHWMLDLDHPSEATAIGDHFRAKDVWETPDTVQTLLRYPDREVQVYFEGTFVNARNRAMTEIMGSEATLYFDRGRYEIHPEPGRKLPYEELILGKGTRGSDFFETPNGERLHLDNWIEAMRSRQKPSAPAEAGVSSAAAAHLANQAMRAGQVAKWGQPAGR